MNEDDDHSTFLRSHNQQPNVAEEEKEQKITEEAK